MDIKEAHLRLCYTQIQRAQTEDIAALGRVLSSHPWTGLCSQAISLQLLVPPHPNPTENAHAHRSDLGLNPTSAPTHPHAETHKPLSASVPALRTSPTATYLVAKTSSDLMTRTTSSTRSVGTCKLTLNTSPAVQCNASNTMQYGVGQDACPFNASPTFAPNHALRPKHHSAVQCSTVWCSVG